MNDGLSTKSAAAAHPADIIVAECGTQAWVVRGDQYIDDLLGNTVPASLRVEVVTCETKAGVDALWHGYGGGDLSNMWIVHPGIVNRTKVQTGSLAVQFAEWSAMMDDNAQTVLQTAVGLLARDSTTVLTLVTHEAAAAPSMAADLGRLRAGLLTAKLEALGVAADRLAQRSAPAASLAETDRILLVIQPR